MTIEEKIKLLEERKKENRLFFSPRMISGGAHIVYDYDSLELYENMDEATNTFAEKEIVNLISKAKERNQEAHKILKLNLIFDGDFDDLPEDLSNPIEYILNNKDKFIAVYKYIKDVEEREFFLGFNRVEKTNKYGYIYLNYSKLFSIFEQNNINYEIDLNVNNYNSGDQETNFILSYNPLKEKVLKK